MRPAGPPIPAIGLSVISIHRRSEGLLRMTSQSVAGILAAIVAAVVLLVAFAYGPIGQFGKPAKVRQPVQADDSVPSTNLGSSGEQDDARAAIVPQIIRHAQRAGRKVQEDEGGPVEDGADEVVRRPFHRVVGPAVDRPDR